MRVRRFGLSIEELREAEANEFAMHLLMPTSMVEQYLAEHGFDICNVEAMAKAFQVPCAVATIRAMEVLRLMRERPPAPDAQEGK